MGLDDNKISNDKDKKLNNDGSRVSSLKMDKFESKNDTLSFHIIPHRDILEYKDSGISECITTINALLDKLHII